MNLLILCYGISIGWSSPNLLILESDESPIGKITKEEASWVASIQCFGGFISNIFFGFITTRFGRKIPLILMAVPTIVHISLTLFKYQILKQYNLIHICTSLDCLVTDFICTKRLLFVCSTVFKWRCRRRCVYDYSALFVRDCNRSVMFFNSLY